MNFLESFRISGSQSRTPAQPSPKFRSSDSEGQCCFVMVLALSTHSRFQVYATVPPKSAQILKVVKFESRYSYSTFLFVVVAIMSALYVMRASAKSLFRGRGYIGKLGG